MKMNGTLQPPSLLDVLHNQVGGLIESNKNMGRIIQDLVKCHRFLLGAQEQQSLLLNDVMTNLRCNGWASFVANKPGNQPDPLKEQLEGLLEMQERQIRQLTIAVADGETQLKDKEALLRLKDEQLLDKQVRIQRLIESQIQPTFHDTTWDSVDSSGYNKTMRGYNLQDHEIRRESSDEEPEYELKCFRRFVEEPDFDLECFSQPMGKRAYGTSSSDGIRGIPFSDNSDSDHSTGKNKETSSGVSCEEEVVLCSMDHLNLWKQQQASFHDVSQSTLNNSTKSAPKQTCCKVKISNLPRDITRQQLNAVFGGSGPIVDVEIAQKAKSAIAFITYHKAGSATYAVKAYSGQQFNRNIVVSFDEEEESVGRKKADGSYASTVKKEGTCQSANSMEPNFFNETPTVRTKYVKTGGRDEPDCLKDRTIYVKNVPYDVSEKTFTDCFKKFGTIESVDIKRREQPGKHAYAFICYKTVPMAQFAKNTKTMIVENSVCSIGNALK